MRSRILLSITFAVFVAVIGAAYFVLPENNTAATTITDTNNAAISDTDSTSNTASATTTSGYTLAAVAQHNNASSCWTAINGKVYNLTSWINQHPGGPENILAICGTDGSAAFNAQHGGERQPANELARFLLGPLSK